MSTSYRDDTTTDRWSVRDHMPAAVPGLAVVLENGAPKFRVTSVGSSPLVIGRGTGAGFFVDDPALSRLHCAVGYANGTWTIEDRSRHGTFVDGERVAGRTAVEDPRILRIGESILVFEPDFTPLLGEAIEDRGGFIVGPRLRAVERDIVAAAEASLDLLVTGESGTGKEWAAETYHRATRRSGAKVPLNCAALPATIFESEVFGHVRGAFSGADRDRLGLVESADAGTLFLDEVAEMPLELQPKLLRVLQERAIRRVGDARERRVDIRVIAATNRILHQEMTLGRFRADLFHRLNKTSVHLPPLRERLEDLPRLIYAELAKLGAPPPSTSFVAEVLLRPWEGNARELASAMIFAAKKAGHGRTGRTEIDHLPGRHVAAPSPSGAPPAPTAKALTPEAIDDALRTHGGNISAAARDLGVHRNTLHRHLARLRETVT
jgi:transcriptional regulator with GAF, ATPase, and Fis domain